MKVLIEYDDLYMLPTWSGATYTKDRILLSGKGSEFCDLVSELWSDGVDQTTLNDFLWFDADFIYESLGMYESEEDLND